MKLNRILFLFSMVFVFTLSQVSVKAVDCENARKLHEKLMCMGEGSYDSAGSGTVKKKKKNFNEKYKTLSDLFKKKEGDDDSVSSSSQNKTAKKKKEKKKNFNEKYKTLADLLKKKE